VKPMRRVDQANQNRRRRARLVWSVRTCCVELQQEDDYHDDENQKKNAATDIHPEPPSVGSNESQSIPLDERINTCTGQIGGAAKMSAAWRVSPEGLRFET
jgi:hypothetical protein